MNIAVLCHPTYGGSGVVGTELGLALARRGHHVHFVSHALPFRLPPDHENTWFHEVSVTRYPLFRYPPYTHALAGTLVEICRRETVDVIHAHYAIPHALCAHLCRQVLSSQLPAIVTTLHGTDITLIGLDSAFREITRFAIEQSDAVTAVSNELAVDTRGSLGTSVDIEVIPNFIDAERFTPALRSAERRAAYAEPEEALLGHLSNFRPVKRVSDVIRTFHIVQKRIPARLLMMGKGVELDSARHLAEELGVGNRVEFLGPLTEVAEVLAQLDLFLLPSEKESFGLAALEAMACGVPVVAAMAGGIPEVVENGVNGFLCDAGDFRCMGATAISILSDPTRLDAMRRAARARAVERFPQERIVDMYEELYEKVILRARKVAGQ